MDRTRRFRHDDRPLEAAEGAFLLRGFHMALAATHQQEDDARRLAEPPPTGEVGGT